MKINKTLIACALFAVAFASCETKENSHKETQPFSMLNYVTNGTDETYSMGITAVTIEYLADNGSSLSVRNVVMPGGSSREFNLTDLTNKSVENGFNFVLSPSSTATGVSDPYIAFYGGSSWIQQWNLFYRFKAGENTVYGMPAVSNYFSRTSVTNPEGTVVMATEAADKNRYQIEINDKDINTANRTLNIYLGAAAFMTGMPAMNMAFQNIPFSVKDGRISFAVDRLVPGIINNDKIVPNDKFPITNLSGSGVFGEEITLQYSCTPTIAAGSSITYTVKSTLLFRVKKSSTEK